MRAKGMKGGKLRPAIFDEVDFSENRSPTARFSFSLCAFRFCHDFTFSRRSHRINAGSNGRENIDYCLLSVLPILPESKFGARQLTE